MKKQLTTILGIIATLSIFSTMYVIGETSSVFAGKPNDPNCFGDSASDDAKSGSMGGHASNQDEPRSGIGNVGEDILGSEEKLHPSEVADALGGQCD